MLKKLFTMLLFIALILLGGAWILKVPMVNYCLGKTLNYEAKIATLTPGFSSTKIGNFYLKNVQGAKVDHALSIEETEANYSLNELRGETLTINEITLRDVTIAVEFYNGTGTNNNWKAITDNLIKEPSADDEKKKMLIRKTVIENLTLLIIRQGSDQIEEKKFDRLVFENIGTDQPIPTDAFIGIFIENLMRQLFNLPQFTNILKGVLEEPTKFLDKLNPFKANSTN